MINNDTNQAEQEKTVQADGQSQNTNNQSANTTERKSDHTDSSTKHKKKVQKQDEKLIKDQEGKFSEGEELEFIRVRFPGNAKSQPFLLGKRKFVYGQKVIAMSDRGMTVGYINSFPYTVQFDKSMLPIRSISKIATDEDIESQKSFMAKEKEAEVLCIRLIEKHNLAMNLTHVEFIQFGKKAVFYFTAPERVDFRGLVKDLVTDLKMRIELRQISVRDRAAALGATGPCGLQTCCSSFLSNYGNVSIKMAKNQNLALIPSKINGVCGQVKCCIKYEDDVYTEKRRFLPTEQTYIRVKNGDIGKVTKLHLLSEQFIMLTDKGYLRRYDRSQYNPKRCFPPKGWRFPTEFRSIISETSNIIGITEREERERSRYSHQIPDDEDIAEEIYIDDEDSSNRDDDEIEKVPLDDTLDDDDIIPDDQKEVNLNEVNDVDDDSDELSENGKRKNNSNRNNRNNRRPQGNRNPRHNRQNNRDSDKDGQNRNQRPRRNNRTNDGSGDGENKKNFNRPRNNKGPRKNFNKDGATNKKPQQQRSDSQPKKDNKD